MTESEKLPWYLNFTNWFIAISLGGFAVLIWFWAGSPGTAPNDGRYSCSSLEDYDQLKNNGQNGIVIVNDITRPQWGATIAEGKLSEVTVYPGKEYPGAPDKSYEATDFSLIKKIDNNSFHISADGSSAVCWK